MARLMRNNYIYAGNVCVCPIDLSKDLCGSQTFNVIATAAVPMDYSGGKAERPHSGFHG